MSTDYQQIAPTSERLKTAMTIRGKKQVDLVRETGIDKGSISHYVSGRYEPKQEAVKKLSAALNVAEMWLWGYDVPMERDKKTSPNELQLSEGEKILLDLFNKVPQEQQQLVLQMIRAALGSQE